MTDPTIPELVARLRELHEKLQALQVGTPEFTAARQLFRDVLQLSAPAILDALICSAIFAERARHAEEVARLRDVHLDETRALDDLRLKEIASLRDQLRKAEGERDEAVAHRLNVMHARRFPSGEFVVAGLIYEAQHITHVHQMGPIRGPEEG